MGIIAGTEITGERVISPANRKFEISNWTWNGNNG